MYNNNLPLSAGSQTIKGGGSSGGIFVGTVTNGGSFPTTRLDTTALQDNDYVRPLGTSTFPFTISGVTFQNDKQKAVYLKGANIWSIDTGFKTTEETPTVDPITESISGTASNQKQINVENKNYIIQKEFSFPIATKEWNIEHNMGKYPNVKILDDNEKEFYGTITFINENNIKVTFDIETNGKVIVN